MQHKWQIMHMTCFMINARLHTRELSPEQRAAASDSMRTARHLATSLCVSEAARTQGAAAVDDVVARAERRQGFVGFNRVHPPSSTSSENKQQSLRGLNYSRPSLCERRTTNLRSPLRTAPTQRRSVAGAGRHNSMAQQPRHHRKGGRSGGGRGRGGGSGSSSNSPAAGMPDALLDEVLTALEKDARGRCTERERSGMFGKLRAFESGPDVPLADPGRVFARIVALLDTRTTSGFASMVLGSVLDSAPRAAQAAAEADVLLPALIRDCARGQGVTLSPLAISTILQHDTALAARALRLGALDALLACAVALESSPAGVPAGETASTALAAAAEVCRLAVKDAGELRAFVEAPRLLPCVAHWLKRSGNPAEARAAAARLVSSIVCNAAVEATVAAKVVNWPGVLRGIADAVADAAAFSPIATIYVAAAASGAARWAGAVRAASMAEAPGFLDGVAAMLAARYALSPEGVPWDLLCFASAELANLLIRLCVRPTRALFGARARLIAALSARVELLIGWAAAGAAGAMCPAAEGGETQLQAVVRRLMGASGILRGIKEADLVRGEVSPPAPAGATAAATVATASAAASSLGGSGGSGSGGDGGGQRALGAGAGGGAAADVASAASASSAGGAATSAPAVAVAAATTAAASSAAEARRRCFACGREDGGGAGGAALLQCGSCKGTGLKAFFCDRACLKAGWKAHKPACEAAQQRQQQRGGGGG